ncbi:S-adenosyl-L-methionine-dependent methyltransferase [Pluteus cervinus]|uniref:S-adenosyl-L-methionine-dependent methyltransferase n=1 Tax=Pluteus cervinus TaxID=181527 RepID=A0ACD3BF76_9AGAR|nr:S-adenosyl-L-methionine-dependent methyltransferase [Pluteus cervinus]
MPQVHQIAQQGFGTGTNELYDSARPSYQSAALSEIRRAVDVKGNINVAEIGSGTGIFTRALLNHNDWATDIGRLHTVEPSEGMRETFAKLLQDERVSVSEGTFEKTGIEDGWADVVIIAQAFHWCADYDQACREFARILKPEGVVALIWNLEDRDGAKWVAELRDTYEQHEAGTPQFRKDLWRQTFATPGYLEFFKPPIEKVWTYTLNATVESVVNRVLSKSYVAVLPEEEKLQVQDNVRTIVGRGDGKIWIDEDKGVFEYPYKTWVVLAHRL